MTGCKKDDDNENSNNSNSNHFTYLGQDYEITEGRIDYYGMKKNGKTILYNFEVELFSSGITSTGDTKSGQGNLVFMDVYSTSAASIAGTYPMGESGYEDIPHFEDGLIIMNGSFDNGWPDDVGILDGSTLKISKDGDIYTFEMEWTSFDNKSITGYYKGELPFYNHDN